MDNGTEVPGSGHEVTSIPGDLPLDLAKYQDDMAELDIPEHQWRELLETLWSIMRMFVELGYSADVGGAVVRQIFNEQARPSGGGEE